VSKRSVSDQRSRGNMNSSLPLRNFEITAEQKG
jgi:hypothetical protein